MSEESWQSEAAGKKTPFSSKSNRWRRTSNDIPTRKDSLKTKSTDKTHSRTESESNDSLMSWRSQKSKGEDSRTLSKGIDAKNFHNGNCSNANALVVNKQETTETKRRPLGTPKSTPSPLKSNRISKLRPRPSPSQSNSQCHTRSEEPSRRRRPGQEAVSQLHSQIQNSLVNQQRKTILQELSVKRAAFKQVTCLRTWPLQERALSHLRQLYQTHMATSDNSPIRSTTVHLEQSPGPYGGGEALTSSSSSSSGVSVGGGEPKRTLRNLMMSPAKSRLKVHFQQAFLAEQQQPQQVQVYSSDNKELRSVFGGALWCMEPRIFSAERSSGGKRKYITGHLGRFVDHYWRKTDPLHRHYYELIPEQTPCRLYFDLEFSKVYNPEISSEVAERLLDEFFEELVDELYSVYGGCNDSSGTSPILKTKLQRSDIVDLDSSTEKKFSRHWIVHLPEGSLFVHAGAVGKFVRDFVSRLANDQATGRLKDRGRTAIHEHLFVKNSDEVSLGGVNSTAAPTVSHGRTTCFIDLGVYTRNRLFRLMGSSKFGKPASASLRIAEANQFPFENFSNQSFYRPAVTEESTDEAISQNGATQQSATKGESSSPSKIADINDEVDSKVRNFVKKTDFTYAAEALAQTLVVPQNATKFNFPTLPFVEEKAADRLTRTLTKAQLPGQVVKPISYGNSPYKMLDEFVLNKLATRGGVQGALRAWSIHYDDNDAPIQIVYQLCRNRWCEAIGRAHKSNNIMWTIDLVEPFHCIQSCHDPDCRAARFRGTPVPLPKPVEEELREELFEQALANIDENKLLAEASRPPCKDDNDTINEALSTLNLNDDEHGISNVGALTLSDKELLDAISQNPENFP